MRKRKKKLSLNKETLKDLGANARSVVGGTNTLSNTCQTCPSINYTCTCGPSWCELCNSQVDTNCGCYSNEFCDPSNPFYSHCGCPCE